MARPEPGHYPAPRRPIGAFVRGFGYAGSGVWYVIRTQRNMRVHLATAIGVIAAGVALRVSATGWACLALAIGLVLTAEAFNTVVEIIADLWTTQTHPLAKAAKDAAAGAVLIASIAAVIVGFTIFIPRL